MLREFFFNFFVSLTMQSKIRIGNEWKALEKLAKKRHAYAMVAVGNNRIAIVGGQVVGSGEHLDSIDVYHLQTKKWSTYKTKEKAQRLMDYLNTYPVAYIRYHASNMVLASHSNRVLSVQVRRQEQGG